MAGQPHVLTGKKCTLCGKEFTRKSIGHDVTVRVKHFVVFVLVCTDCKDKHRKGDKRDELKSWAAEAFG